MTAFTQRITHAMAVLLGLAALALALATAGLAWVLQWSGPFRDLWEVLPLIEASFAGQWSWAELWAPYGGAHRLLLPRLLFLADYHLLAGSNRLILSASLACQGLTAWLLFRRVAAAFPADPTARWLGLAAILLTLFGGTQLFNFNYSYDTQWFQATLFSVLALLLATDPGLPARPWRYLPLIWLAAGLAGLSNMAGLLVWPVLTLLLAVSPLPRAARLASLPVLAAVLAVYGWGLGSGDAPTPTDFIAANPAGWLLGMSLHGIRFVALYLGSPLTRHWPLAGGLLAVLGMAWLLAAGWRQRHAGEAAAALCRLAAALALLVLLVALATAWGRVFNGLSVAVAERYQTTVLLFWLALALGGIAALAGPHRRWLLPLPVVLLAAGLAYDHGQSSLKAIQLSNSVRTAHLGAGMGLTDMAVARHTLAFPAIGLGRNDLARHNGFLQQQRLAYFRDPALAWLGQTLPAIDSRPDCTPQLQHSEPVGDTAGRRVSGLWPCAGERPQLIALIDSSRRVIGLARLHGPLLERRQWSGYVPAAVAGMQPVALFAGDSPPGGRP